MLIQQQRGQRRLGFVVAAFCLCTATAQTTNAKQVIKSEDQEIALQGTIRLVHDFGPPGYGEDPKHDAHVSYWAIEVPIPINTPCTPEKPEWTKYDCESAKRMKLFFSGLELTKLENLPAAKWKDHHVIVRGRIHRADVAGEMTPIYIDVTSISALRGVPTN